MSRIRTVLLSLGLSTVVVAQQVFVVSGGGTALQVAVDRANPGDTLDVLAGTYGPVVVSKGITIECRSGVKVDGGQLAALTVDSLPAGEVLAFTGGFFTAWRPVLLDPVVAVTRCQGTTILDSLSWDLAVSFFPRFRIAACNGPVIIRRVNIGGGPTIVTYAVIEDSAQVSLTGCTDLPPLQVYRSNLSVAGCRFTGRYASNGITATDSYLAISDSTISGGSTGHGFIGLPGIDMTRGQAVIAGATTITAGNAISLTSAVRILNSSVRFPLGVTFLPATHPPVIGPGKVVLEPVPSVEATGAHSGAVFDMLVRAEPHSLTATFIGTPQVPISLPFGNLWLAINSPVFNLQVTPVTGQFRVAGAVPALPKRLALVLQPITLTLAGTLSVGTPTRVVMN